MGYYTTFSLDFDAMSSDVPEDSIVKLREYAKSIGLNHDQFSIQYKNLKDSVIDYLDTNIDNEYSTPWNNLFSGESYKWYNYVDDMKALSKVFPTVLFKVYCRGEDGELWAVYFFNGKSQEEDAIITYPEFDESKLF